MKKIVLKQYICPFSLKKTSQVLGFENPVVDSDDEHDGI